MDGSEMTLVFDDLISQISAEEIATDTKAVVADIDLISISDIESNLLVKVLYGKGIPSVETPPAMISWTEASTMISTNCILHLLDLYSESNGCTIFFPEAIIYFGSDNTSEPDCTVDGTICLSSLTLSESNSNSYDSDWIGDIDSGAHEKTVPTQSGEEFFYYHTVNGIAAFAQGYCY